MPERSYDDTVKDTFPASDPTTQSGTAGPEGDKKPADKPQKDDFVRAAD